ncbi:MAG: hypothetical protein CMI54_08710 [Parcubacteria group bacterium]|nr:hypothetical protein [Parcubacteria group bacterium]
MKPELTDLERKPFRTATIFSLESKDHLFTIRDLYTKTGTSRIVWLECLHHMILRGYLKRTKAKKGREYLYKLTKPGLKFAYFAKAIEETIKTWKRGAAK